MEHRKFRFPMFFVSLYILCIAPVWAGGLLTAEHQIIVIDPSGDGSTAVYEIYITNETGVELTDIALVCHSPEVDPLQESASLTIESLSVGEKRVVHWEAQNPFLAPRGVKNDQRLFFIGTAQGQQINIELISLPKESALEEMALEDLRMAGE